MRQTPTLLSRRTAQGDGYGRAVSRDIGDAGARERLDDPNLCILALAGLVARCRIVIGIRQCEDWTVRAKKRAQGLGVELDRSSAVSVYQQIAIQIKEWILQGRLPEKYRLPSERKLAQELGVHRTTIVHAYDELRSAGPCWLAQR